jgi:hypothetical protein
VNVTPNGVVPPVIMVGMIVDVLLLPPPKPAAWKIKKSPDRISSSSVFPLRKQRKRKSYSELSLPSSLSHASFPD